MGKTTRWFRSLFGGKRPSTKEEKKKNWVSDGKYYETRGSSFGGASSSSPYVEPLEANKHAIAVAAATAAVAEAALAAAHAAAEVVRLTAGSGRSSVTTPYFRGGGKQRRRELAAVKIQSAFRAYLARRALRALKGLVKLQALVRGHIVRKQSADMLRRMQAMARVQARACANRACTSASSHSSTRSSHSHSHHLSSGSKSNVKGSVGLERPHIGSNWLDHWMEETSWGSRRDTFLKNARADDEKSDKILEIDTWKPRLKPNPSIRSSQNMQHWNHKELHFSPPPSLSRLPSKSRKPSPSLLSREVLPLGSMIFQEAEQAVWTNENSPRLCSASSRPSSSNKRSPFTPARSEYSRSLFGDYPIYPNYMANTESYRAKLRSQSAPRQRMQFNRPGSTQTLRDVDSNSERDLNSPTNFRTKAYPTGGGY